MQGVMRLISINAGEVETIHHGGVAMTTGICKQPLQGAVLLTAAGIAGDAIVDKVHHGGPDQAIYAYSDDDYQWWRDTTGKAYAPGLFGENLTIQGLPSNLTIGDRLLINDVVLEATSARIPCKTFAARLEDSGFGMAFRQAERPGTYFRVLNEGYVEVGDAVTLVETTDTDVTVVDLFRHAFALRHDAAQLRRFLDAPIAARIRDDVASKLRRLEGGSTAS